MRIDSSQVTLASAYSFQAEQQFSGTYTASSAASGASSGTSPSSDVQISTAGQQAAANDPGNMNSVISPQMSIFKSMLEQMLGVSIQAMQFSGDISEQAQSGNAAQVSQQGNHAQGASVSYAAEAIQLNTKGTLTTSDGRTISFSAGMSLLQVSTSATVASFNSGNQARGSGDQQTGAPTRFDTSGWPSISLTNPQSGSSAASATPTARKSAANAGTGNLIPASASADGVARFVISLNQMLLQQMSDWLKDRGASHILPDSLAARSNVANATGSSAGGTDALASVQNSATQGAKAHGGHSHHYRQGQDQTPSEALNISV